MRWPSLRSRRPLCGAATAADGSGARAGPAQHRSTPSATVRSASREPRPSIHARFGAALSFSVASSVARARSRPASEAATRAATARARQSASASSACVATQTSTRRMMRAASAMPRTKSAPAPMLCRGGFAVAALDVVGGCRVVIVVVVVVGVVAVWSGPPKPPRGDSAADTGPPRSTTLTISAGVVAVVAQADPALDAADNDEGAGVPKGAAGSGAAGTVETLVAVGADPKAAAVGAVAAGAGVTAKPAAGVVVAVEVAAAPHDALTGAVLATVALVPNADAAPDTPHAPVAVGTDALAVVVAAAAAAAAAGACLEPKPGGGALAAVPACHDEDDPKGAAAAEAAANGDAAAVVAAAAAAVAVAVVEDGHGGDDDVPAANAPGPLLAPHDGAVPVMAPPPPPPAPAPLATANAFVDADDANGAGGAAPPDALDEVVVVGKPNAEGPMGKVLKASFAL